MRNRKWAVTLMSALALGLCSSGIAVAKEWKAVTIGVEGAFPPFNGMTATGQVEGYDIDVAHEVCRRATLDCKIVAQDWDSQIPSLLAGKFDAVLTMGPNPKRREVIDFSDPYAVTPNSFLVDASGPLANLPHTGERVNVDQPEGKKVLEELQKALKGTTIGAALSTSQLQFSEDNFKDAQVRSYKSSEQSQLDLESGRIDAQFDNIVFVTDRAAKSNGALKASGPFLSGSIMATDVCFGIRKNEPDLKTILDKAIEEARADGTLEKLSQKWFKTDVSPKG
ncbi:amino acid ABC transporter substrate-binding protein, PAAT family [Faunimonas pinastri]|uniref:Amino acid ABC transporter substrate-binding protein, PAAT family n=1 Tax=Faunimonas pinastri TaxID=1855383 RepID=A0A1H9K9X7_9HYPH|nr:transporter substrate-binding domain-containing protein [Faunimonas pinastri]SEQ95882.1 amino acid ABC transporter substrate-binding protein, PAAT family [Faunimonas pinastri]